LIDKSEYLDQLGKYKEANQIRALVDSCANEVGDPDEHFDDQLKKSSFLKQIAELEHHI